jgi:hypothetical protein
MLQIGLLSGVSTTSRSRASTASASPRSGPTSMQWKSSESARTRRGWSATTSNGKSSARSASAFTRSGTTATALACPPTPHPPRPHHPPPVGIAAVAEPFALAFGSSPWTRPPQPDPIDPRCSPDAYEARARRPGAPASRMAATSLSRRTTKLFLPNGGCHFWSRPAYGLGYACQREDRFGRLQRRAAMLNRQLGGEGWSSWDTPPTKPKWMRWRTYEEKYEIWERAVDEANTESTVRAMRILRRPMR